MISDSTDTLSNNDNNKNQCNKDGNGSQTAHDNVKERFDNCPEINNKKDNICHESAFTNDEHRSNSECSSLSSEGDDLSFAFEGEMLRNCSDCDDNTSLELRLLSPFERTLSPIGRLQEDIDTPTRQPNAIDEMCQNNPNFIPLHELNALLTPPEHDEKGDDAEKTLSKTCSLETIFEGIFLHTPPRPKLNGDNSPISAKRPQSRNRTNLIEKIALSHRLQAGKENKSPTCDSDNDTLAIGRTSSPKRNQEIEQKNQSATSSHTLIERNSM